MAQEIKRRGEWVKLFRTTENEFGEKVYPKEPILLRMLYSPNKDYNPSFRTWSDTSNVYETLPSSFWYQGEEEIKQGDMIEAHGVRYNVEESQSNLPLGAVFISARRLENG